MCTGASVPEHATARVEVRGQLSGSVLSFYLRVNLGLYAWLQAPVPVSELSISLECEVLMSNAYCQIVLKDRPSG